MTALEGIRVLDFTRVLAGPYCSMTLGDLGAEIVKIENPAGGDDTRGFSISKKLGVSTYFLAVNRNKKSAAIDFRKPEGRDAILAMAKNADVIVENFRTGVMDRYGLGYEAIRAVNPKLVFCSISAYGREGALKDRPGYDPIVQGESGFMSLTGERDGGPIRTGVSIIDIITGLFAGEAILAALIARGRTGEGQRIDVPLYDTAINMLHHATTEYLIDDKVLGRAGNGNLIAQPVGVYEASDGPMMIAMTNNRMFSAFCNDVLERPEFAEDPRFKDNMARVDNGTALNTELYAIFAGDTRGNWLRKLDTAGIPAGEVLDVGEALSSAAVIERNLLTRQPHSEFGEVPGIRSPMTLSGTPVTDQIGAPVLGAHTEAVLREVAGLDAVAIDAMKTAGVIPE